MERSDNMALLEAADILDFAMQLEQNGEAFYLAVAQKSERPHIRALFEELAEQEVQHHAIFGKLRQTVQHEARMTDETWDRYLGYLNATVQNALFEGQDKALARAEEVTDEKDALRMAIAFEKETLLFFHDLKDAVAEADRPIVEKVLDEEKSHIRRLAEML
jgi:rubrerythrin